MQEDVKRMKRPTFPPKRFLSALLMLLGTFVSEAQTAWTLDSCIQYAMDHNIRLQQNILAQQQADISLAQSREALFPSLSFSTNHSLRYMPGASGSSQLSSDGTQIIQSTGSTTYSGSYGLNAGVTVFNGGRNVKNIRLQELNVVMAELDIAQQANTLQEQIAQLYVQILYATEAIQVNRATLELAEQQRDRAQVLLEVGKLAKSDVAQLEAQVSNHNYQLVNAESQLRSYKLQLKQLLEIGDTAAFDISLPVLSDELALAPLPGLLETWETARSSRPEIQNSRLEVESADLNVDIARAGYYPSVSVSAGAGTSAGGYENYGAALVNNFNATAGLSVSVPIYDQRQNKSAVQKARLQQQNSQLALQEEEKTLYSTIEGLWLDATTAQEKFRAAHSSVESAQESLHLVSEQFSVGLKNTIELLTEKNNLLSAQQDMLQAKYTAILDAQLLRFYSGEKINL